MTKKVIVLTGVMVLAHAMLWTQKTGLEATKEVICVGHTIAVTAGINQTKEDA